MDLALSLLASGLSSAYLLVVSILLVLLVYLAAGGRPGRTTPYLLLLGYVCNVDVESQYVDGTLAPSREGRLAV